MGRVLRLEDMETTLLENFAIKYGEMGRSQQTIQLSMEGIPVVGCLSFNKGSISPYTEKKPPIEAGRETITVKVLGR